MSFSYKFLKFQRGNHDTKEKLEFYEDFIMRLLEELETLRDTVCTSCQQTCASSKAARSKNRLLVAPNDSMPQLKRRRIEDPLPHLPETDIFLRTPAPGSSSLPTNEKISVSSSLVEITTERNKLSNESNDRLFRVERDAFADPTLYVRFMYSFRHENWVRCVCFSRDGRYLAVGLGSDPKRGSIVIYQVGSNEKYCELREYATQYGSYTRPHPWKLCFSSEGRYLAVSDVAKRTIIWDVLKTRIRSIFHGSHQTYDVRFSPDGRLVAFCTDGGVVVLNMRDNSRRMGSEGRCFDFNPGGRLIATGKDDVLAILDVRAGKVVKRWNGHGSTLRSVKFTSDGRGLTCMYNDMVEQWDVGDAKPVLIRKFDYQTYSYRISFSPDHRLVVRSEVLLDVNNGKRQYTLEGHNGHVRCVDFSPAGTYLALGDYDGFVSLWKYTWT